MNLPSEIRLLIYSYLVPAGRVGAFASKRVLDGNGRCPALLRVNRQIYSELLSEWYGSAWYGAHLDLTGFHLHGCFYSIHKPIPSTLQYIRQLDLFILLILPSHYVSKKAPLGLYELTRFLQRCFESQRVNRLQRLHLRLAVTQEFVNFYTGKQAALRKDLAQALAPLRNLRGLLETKLKVVSLASSFRIGSVARQNDKPFEEVHRGILDFWKLLAKQMSSSN
jgi:hypothetical protein